MIDAVDAGGDFYPVRELAGALEVVVRLRVRRNSHVREPLEHDERVVRAAAQRLRAREQIHQRGIVRRPDLHRSPREVVKSFVLAPIRCRKGQLATIAPLGAAAVSRRLVERDEQNEQSKHMITPRSTGSPFLTHFPLAQQASGRKR